jgi:hypothetical protein
MRAGPGDARASGRFRNDDGARHNAYREAGGPLENPQAVAAHESPRTTKLYDRTGDEIPLDEVERIAI